MPNSLKCKLSSLRYNRLLTDEEYQELIKKLDGHDREIRNKAIDDFAKEIEAEYDNDDCPNVADYLDYEISIRKLFEIAEQLKGE